MGRGQGTHPARQPSGVRDLGIEEDMHGMQMQGNEIGAQALQGRRGFSDGAVCAMHAGQVTQGTIMPAKYQSTRECDLDGDELIEAIHIQGCRPARRPALAAAGAPVPRPVRRRRAPGPGVAARVQASPEVEPAASHYRQALTLAEELGMRPLQAHCHHGLGMLYATGGQPEQARAELSMAIEMYRDMEMTFWLPETEAALG